jgi:hypothetical protein
MLGKKHVLGAMVLTLVGVFTLTTRAEAQEMRCRGGSNSGAVCTTDADCPSGCARNADHPFCDATTPCVGVCQGGDTPGATCPDRMCPGVCVGGDNPGAACTRYRDPVCTGGGSCSARCVNDRCQVGRCKPVGASGAALQETEDDEDANAASVACTSSTGVN